MLQDQRHQKILDYLEQNVYLSVTKAEQVYKTSRATICRDFEVLAGKKLVERVRGGIKHRNVPIDCMSDPFDMRKREHLEIKKSIGQKAVSLLNAGDSLFIDGGTTSSCVADFLPDLDLRVITNSLRIATSVESKNLQNANIELYLCGGFFYAKASALLGPQAEAGLSLYHAKWAFLSVGGLNQFGFFHTNALMSEIEKIMINNAEKTVLLADNTKIGQSAMCKVCNLDRISILITNDAPENIEVLHTFENQGIQVIKV